MAQRPALGPMRNWVLPTDQDTVTVTLAVLRVVQDLTTTSLTIATHHLAHHQLRSPCPLTTDQVAPPYFPPPLVHVVARLSVEMVPEMHLTVLHVAVDTHHPNITAHLSASRTTTLAMVHRPAHAALMPLMAQRLSTPDPTTSPAHLTTHDHHTMTPGPLLTPVARPSARTTAPQPPIPVRSASRNISPPSQQSSLAAN